MKTDRTDLVGKRITYREKTVDCTEAFEMSDPDFITIIGMDDKQKMSTIKVLKPNEAEIVVADIPAPVPDTTATDTTT